MSVPYNAAIIAHEKMSAFAYISVIEVTLKLIIVYMLLISPFDGLATYAVLLLLVGATIRFIYGSYCKRHFEECTYHFVIDKPILKEMTGFAGWNFLGNGAYMLNTQGVNILMNLYFGVAVNAARGIATQVDAALRQFVNNFTTAVNPQITKSYAQGDLDYMHKLVCRSAKFSAFLMMFFCYTNYLGNAKHSNGMVKNGTRICRGISTIDNHFLLCRYYSCKFFGDFNVRNR